MKHMTSWTFNGRLMCVSTYRAYECAVLCVVHMSRKRNKFDLTSPELHSVVLAYYLYNCVCVCMCVCVRTCLYMLYKNKW